MARYYELSSRRPVLPFRMSRQWLPVLGCLFGLHTACLAAAAPAPETPRYEVTQATLREAMGKAAGLLHCRILLTLEPSHPAHKVRVSLTMPIGDPDDLLNALTAAFGLRWLSGQKPEEVLIVDKHAYQGSEAGLRHAVADALPVGLRAAVLSDTLTAPAAMEKGLKELEDRYALQLRAATAGGWVPVSTLGPTLSRPMLDYLAGWNRRGLTSAFRSLVQFVRDQHLQVEPLFHYGPTGAGAGPTFNFRMGSRSVGVTPGT